METCDAFRAFPTRPRPPGARAAWLSTAPCLSSIPPLLQLSKDSRMSLCSCPLLSGIGGKTSPTCISDKAFHVNNHLRAVVRVLVVVRLVRWSAACNPKAPHAPHHRPHRLPVARTCCVRLSELIIHRVQGAGSATFNIDKLSVWSGSTPPLYTAIRMVHTRSSRAAVRTLSTAAAAAARPAMCPQCTDRQLRRLPSPPSPCCGSQWGTCG